LARLARVRPETEPSETPLSKSSNAANDWRGQELSDLWRTYFAAAGAGEADVALGTIRKFFKDEARLVQGWEEKRRNDSAPYLKQVIQLSTFAALILGSLRQAHDKLEDWPMLAPLYRCLRDDAQVQLDRIQARTGRLATNTWVPERSAGSPT
jgi:hypothetical protein